MNPGRQNICPLGVRCPTAGFCESLCMLCGATPAVLKGSCGEVETLECHTSPTVGIHADFSQSSFYMFPELKTGMGDPRTKLPPTQTR
jgi:hypothetical protein